MASETILKQKEEEVKKLAEKMKNSSLILLADYRGINVADVTELRKKLRQANGSYNVIKNNITRRALAECNIEGLDESLVGPTAVITAEDSYLDSLKAVLDFDSIGNYGYFLHYHDYFNTTPNKVKNDQIFSYPSKDDRKVCDVVTYTQLDRKDQKGVLQARSYDIHDHDCRYSEEECADDYWANHRKETIINTKIVDVDGVPVVLNTVGNSLHAGFYGYGVSCLDYLNQFER